ncbi:MAG: hypothetical protein ABIZ18_09885, partial [Caldimonas sp.]
MDDRVLGGEVDVGIRNAGDGLEGFFDPRATGGAGHPCDLQIDLGRVNRRKKACIHRVSILSVTGRRQGHPSRHGTVKRPGDIPLRKRGL